MSEVQPEPIPRRLSPTALAAASPTPSRIRAAPTWPLRSILVLVVVVARWPGSARRSGRRLVAGPRPSDSTARLAARRRPAAARPGRRDSVAGVVRRVLPSVVTLKVAGGGEADTGSGFVVRSDGYVVTNNHVVAAAAAGGTISVVFADGKSSQGHGRRQRRVLRPGGRQGGAHRAAGAAARRVQGRRRRRPGHRRRRAAGAAGLGDDRHRQRPEPAGLGRRRGRARSPRSSTPSRPTRRSTPATPAARWSTPPGDVIGVNSAIAQLPGSAGARCPVGQHRRRVRHPERPGPDHRPSS